MKLAYRNKWLVFAAIGLIGTCAFAYYQYNKGPVNIKSASAQKIEAVQLYKAYTSDSVSAQKNFNGKVLEVRGKIEALTSNQNNEKLLLLNTGEEDAFVNCTLEEENVEGLSKGDMVSLKGICTGLGQAEPDLGIKADLYLTRAYLNR